MISFFIPFYNEEKKGKKLNFFLKDLKKFIKHPANKKNYFLLYNDGSTDRTQVYLENFKKQFKGKKILILSNINNRGVGYSFKKTIKHCKSKFLFFLPGDYDLSFEDLLHLNKYTKYDLTSLFPINFEKYSTGRYFLSMIFRMIYGIAFGVNVNYIQSPCLYKVKNLKKHKFLSNRFSIWPEVNIKLLRTNINFIEIPVLFKNKSVIDRTVSLKNFLEIVIMFLLTFLEIKVFKRSFYKGKAKKNYV